VAPPWAKVWKRCRLLSPITEVTGSPAGTLGAVRLAKKVSPLAA